MPGLWIHLGENPDFYKEFSLEKGTYIETVLYDDQHDEQGKALWRIYSAEEKKKSGLWTTAKLVAASDTHLKWWLTTGPGAAAQRKFHLHFCTEAERTCGKTKRKPSSEFHTDYFRSVTADEIINLKIPWMKSAEAKEDMAAEVAKLTGTPAGAGQRKKGKDANKGKEPGLDWDVTDDDLPAAAETEGKEDPGVKEKLDTLKEDLKGDSKKKAKEKDDVKKKAKKKSSKERKKSRSRGRRRKRALASESSQDKYARGKWFGKAAEVSSSSSTYSSEEQEEEPAATGKEKKKKDEPKSSKEKSKKKKKKKKSAADRGPFGAGPSQRYDGKASDVEEEESEEKEETSVFRAGVSQKSKQLQLQEYSMKYPGRLTARLLKKMQEVLAREETPMKHIDGQNMTPAVATSYLLTVTMVQYKDRLNMRTLRELKSLSKALDYVVQAAPERAADVISQRIKAIEVSLSDQNWNRAQHLELIGQEGAVLLEKDELAMATKEMADDQKLKAAQGSLGWRPSQWKGDPQDKGKGKGKGKNKKGKPNQSGWQASGDQEKPPPA